MEFKLEHVLLFLLFVLLFKMIMDKCGCRGKNPIEGFNNYDTIEECYTDYFNNPNHFPTDTLCPQIATTENDHWGNIKSSARFDQSYFTEDGWDHQDQTVHYMYWLDENGRPLSQDEQDNCADSFRVSCAERVGCPDNPIPGVDQSDYGLYCIEPDHRVFSDDFMQAQMENIIQHPELYRSPPSPPPPPPPAPTGPPLGEYIPFDDAGQSNRKYRDMNECYNGWARGYIIPDEEGGCIADTRAISVGEDQFEYMPSQLQENPVISFTDTGEREPRYLDGNSKRGDERQGWFLRTDGSILDDDGQASCVEALRNKCNSFIDPNVASPPAVHLPSSLCGYCDDFPPGSQCLIQPWGDEIPTCRNDNESDCVAAGGTYCPTSTRCAEPGGDYCPGGRGLISADPGTPSTPPPPESSPPPPESSPPPPESSPPPRRTPPPPESSPPPPESSPPPPESSPPPRRTPTLLATAPKPTPDPPLVIPVGEQARNA